MDLQGRGFFDTCYHHNFSPDYTSFRQNALTAEVALIVKTNNGKNEIVFLRAAMGVDPKGGYIDNPAAVFNEPAENTWPEAKAYAEAVIKVIREKDPNNIILVGCPRWDQELQLCGDGPIDYKQS